MSSTTDKIKGVTNEAVGKTKQGIGNMAIDSDKMKVEGAIQEAQGRGPAGRRQDQGCAEEGDRRLTPRTFEASERAPVARQASFFFARDWPRLAAPSSTAVTECFPANATCSTSHATSVS